MRHWNINMERLPLHPLTQDEIHALVDGQLSPGAREALQSRLALDADAQATVLQWQQQRSALRALHQPMLDEALPAALLAAVQKTAASQQEINQWWRWGGIAASVMLAFGGGWFSHTVWQIRAPSLALAKIPAAQDFARQAGLAHVVYSPEVRHPVEVSAAEQEHLLQWLSKRVGKPLKVPNLGPLGYELMGGRLLLQLPDAFRFRS